MYNLYADRLLNTSVVSNTVRPLLPFLRTLG